MWIFFKFCTKKLLNIYWGYDNTYFGFFSDFGIILLFSVRFIVDSRDSIHFHLISSLTLHWRYQSLIQTTQIITVFLSGDEIGQNNICGRDVCHWRSRNFCKHNETERSVRIQMHCDSWFKTEILVHASGVLNPTQGAAEAPNWNHKVKCGILH